MGRAQFEYDEQGNTFFYVLISFYAVVLFPLTHFLWPSAPKKLVIPKIGCQCEGDVIKRNRREAVKPWESRKRILKAVFLTVLWIVFVFLIYQVSQIEHTHEEYDPYKILGLDQGADVAEVKKKYRELSKTHHPDRGGDAAAFDYIAKAYQALTDDESRENWEKYGNPDGPKATTFGIALPKWIVSEQYGLWVLALYGLIFMLILPVGVGWWWYSSMKYSADKVLLETTRIFYHFLSKTPSMEVNRALMVLSASFEFFKKSNPEIVERESDDVELPRLMKELRNLGENKKEAPFYYPYSIKARALLHAYLGRIELDSKHLEGDQEYMVGRVLSLLDEFLRVLLQMMIQIPMQRPPTLDTLENVLKLYPMFVQALWPRNSPLLQLPHITDQKISFLRKNRVISCQDLANLNEFKRQALLNTLNEQEYEDIVSVLAMMPKLEVETHLEVQGEEDKETVTVGSVVTLKVVLRRSALLDPKKRDQEVAIGPVKVDKPEPDPNNQQPKRKVWEKQKPKKKTNKGKAAKKLEKKKKADTAVGEGEKEKAEEQPEDAANHSVTGSESESEGSASEDDDYNKSDYDRDLESSGSEDDGWDEDNVVVKKEVLMDKEPTNHHEVHCPHFPHEKFEWWYLYVMEVQAAREPVQIKYEDTEDEEEKDHASESSEEYTEASADEDED
ncbi:Translocation protein SEC63-like protein [Aphelenchoides fujianensis]|nr:Translocation protein SEC63-like protein [Aphelenchoides fujianensis]